MQQEFGALRVERRGAAATVHMMWPDGRIERLRQFHTEFPIALQQLRVRLQIFRVRRSRLTLNAAAPWAGSGDPLGAPKSASSAIR
jgi:hypothetical protein